MESIWKVEKLTDDFIIFIVSKHSIQIKCSMIVKVVTCYCQDCSKQRIWTSLVVQWLGLCLPLQETQVWSLVQEDSTCHRVTGPMHHNRWACAPQSPCSATREATLTRSLCNATREWSHLLQLEKVHVATQHCQRKKKDWWCPKKWNKGVKRKHSFKGQKYKPS